MIATPHSKSLTNDQATSSGAGAEATWQSGGSSPCAPYVCPYSAIYAGYASRPQDRRHVASGGLATVLLAEALRGGVVDGVVVSKADFADGSIGSRIDIVTDPDRVQDYGTSVYFDIPVERHWRALDQFHGSLAVCSLPCHTDILRRRKLSGRSLDNVKLFVSLFCGHNSQAELLRFVFHREGIDEAQVASMYIDRSHLGGDVRVQLRDGSERVFPFRHFNVYRSLGFFSKPLCHHCDDHLGFHADLSIGDLFTGKYRHTGVKHSALIVRTEPGAKLVQLARENGSVRLEELDPDLILRAQKRVLIPSGDLMSRYWACWLVGVPARKPQRGAFRFRSFLTYAALLFNDRLSQRRWGRKLIRSLPRPFLYSYVAVIKLVNTTLGCNK
jgi:coenzyme F420-reducing hydrogenase beta subunit